MEKREKIEFLLEQMRLCLFRNDFIRAQIISRKINTRSFDDVNFHVSFDNRNIVSDSHGTYFSLSKGFKIEIL
jgi:hypothetical protein